MCLIIKIPRSVVQNPNTCVGEQKLGSKCLVCICCKILFINDFERDMQNSVRIIYKRNLNNLWIIWLIYTACKAHSLQQSVTSLDSKVWIENWVIESLIKKEKVYVFATFYLDFDSLTAHSCSPYRLCLYHRGDNKDSFRMHLLSS